MFKKFFGITIISTIFILCFVAASPKPVAIIATVGIDSPTSGHIYPDIVIGEDGTWKEGGSNDLFSGQIFTVFKGPNNGELSKKLIIKSNNGELPLSIDNNANLKPGFRYWACYNSNTSFKNKGIEKLIESKSVNPKALNQLQNKFSKSSIPNIVTYDFDNIYKDFNLKVGKNILQFARGDINGDNIPDYAVAVGKGYGLPGEGIVVVLYVSDRKSYKRIPVKTWKNKSEYLSGPDAFIFKDVNGDKAEELFIIDANSDASYPIVYSWFGKGIQKVYAGNTELWGGI